MASGYSQLASLDTEDEEKPKNSYKELASLSEEPADTTAEENVPWWKQAASQVGRQVGLAGRAVVHGVAGIPELAADTGVAARNLAFNLSHGETPTWADFNPFATTGGSHQEYELPSAGFERGLSEAGLPQPANWYEKGTGLVMSALTGSRMPAPEGMRAPSAEETQAGMSTTAPANFISANPKTGLTGAQQRALEDGKSVGMKTTPGQASGSKSLQQVEARLESHPSTSSPAFAIKDSNQVALNRAWAKAIGENSDAVDSTVMARAADRLGDAFDSVRDVRPRPIDPQQFTQRIGSIESDFEGLLPSGVSEHPLVNKLIDLAGKGEASGRELGSLSSKLGRAAAKQMTSGNGDRDLGMALYQVKDYVDDLVSSGLSPEEQAAYSTARQQYRSLMQLTSRVGNVNSTTGNVSGPNMANYLQQTDKRGFLQGQNASDAYKATRFAQAFKPIVGDSGTATRGASGLVESVISVPARIGSKIYYSGKVPTAPTQGTLRSLVMGSSGLRRSNDDEENK